MQAVMNCTIYTTDVFVNAKENYKKKSYS